MFSHTHTKGNPEGSEDEPSGFVTHGAAESKGPLKSTPAGPRIVGSVPPHALPERAWVEAVLWSLQEARQQQHAQSGKGWERL